MPFFKVRPGQLLGHHGQTLEEGAVIELPAHIGAEIGQVDPCDADGKTLAALSPEALRVAQARVHERVSILETQVAAAKTALADAEARLAEEKALAAPKVAPVVLTGTVTQFGTTTK